MGDASDAVEAAATGVARHDAVRWGVRAGYVASGIVHLTIAWLALVLLRRGPGSGEAEVDQSGAFAALVSTPLGAVLLAAMAVGLVLLAVWQITEVIRRSHLTDRLKAGGKAVAYVVLAVSALRYLSHTGVAATEQTQDVTRTVLQWPGGPVLVGAGALAVLGVGIYHVHKGVTGRFRRDLVDDPGRVAVWAARLGYALKGVAFLAMGGLLVGSAVSHDASSSRGLDGALKVLLGLPAGVVLVALVSGGFAAYGLYSFFRARYTRM